MTAEICRSETANDAFTEGRVAYIAHGASEKDTTRTTEISEKQFLFTKFYLFISNSPSNRGCFINISLPKAYYMSFCSEKCAL